MPFGARNCAALPVGLSLVSRVNPRADLLLCAKHLFVAAVVCLGELPGAPGAATGLPQAPRRGTEDAAGGPFTQENCQHAPLIRRHVRQSGRCFDHHGHLPLVRASPKGETARISPGRAP